MKIRYIIMLLTCILCLPGLAQKKTNVQKQNSVLRNKLIWPREPA